MATTLLRQNPGSGSPSATQRSERRAWGRIYSFKKSVRGWRLFGPRMPTEVNAAAEFVNREGRHARAAHGAVTGRECRQAAGPDRISPAPAQLTSVYRCMTCRPAASPAWPLLRRWRTGATSHRCGQGLHGSLHVRIAWRLHGLHGLRRPQRCDCQSADTKTGCTILLVHSAHGFSPP